MERRQKKMMNEEKYELHMGLSAGRRPQHSFIHAGSSIY
jgi:hypothetical protein